MLDGQTLGDIWYGNIIFWNDTAIQALNPNTTLPEERILLGYASDAIGGLTQMFTTFLVETNADFAAVWDPIGNANWTLLTGIQDHVNNTGYPGTNQTDYVKVPNQTY